MDKADQLLYQAANELGSLGDECDHSVGICWCEFWRFVDAILVYLQLPTTCHECGGDGFVYNLADEQIKCEICGGKGWYHNHPQLEE